MSDLSNSQIEWVDSAHERIRLGIASLRDAIASVERDLEMAVAAFEAGELVMIPTHGVDLKAVELTFGLGVLAGFTERGEKDESDG